MEILSNTANMQRGQTTNTTNAASSTTAAVGPCYTAKTPLALPTSDFCVTNISRLTWHLGDHSPVICFSVHLSVHPTNVLACLSI